VDDTPLSQRPAHLLANRFDDATCKRCGRGLLRGELVLWRPAFGSGHIECLTDFTLKTAGEGDTCGRCGEPFERGAKLLEREGVKAHLGCVEPSEVQFPGRVGHKTGSSPRFWTGTGDDPR